MRLRDYIGSVLVVAVLLTIGIWFSSFQEVSFSPTDEIRVIRHLPSDYVKGQDFQVTLEVIIQNGFSSSDRLLISDLVENAVVTNSSGDSFYSEDLVVWGNLTVENQNLTYKVVSNADSLSFQGRWGLGETSEDSIGGISSVSAQNSGTLGSPGGGGPSGSGGGFMPADEGDETDYSEDTNQQDDEDSSGVDTNQDSGDSSGNQDSGSGFNYWWIVVFVLAIAILGIIIYFIFWKKNQNKDLMY